MRRRMLGPMALDAASNALVGVGVAYANCTALAGYECVTPEAVMRENWDNPEYCLSCCNQMYNYQWVSFDSQNQVCYCLPSNCAAFVPGPTYEYLGYEKVRHALFALCF